MRKLLLVLLALAAMASGMLARHWLNAAPAADPDLAIEFPDPEGKSHRLDEWKGKVLIVNFWATWCPPCLKEMPEFVQLQNELGEKGLQFVGIAIDDAQSVRDFLASAPVNYPILIGEDGGADWAAGLGNLMNILPFSAVFDRSGRLVQVQAGPFNRDDVLKAVSPLLETSASVQ
jgi:thiol-disulfide isomerase/thioredoxin